jgi:hypothetical protein
MQEIKKKSYLRGKVFQGLTNPICEAGESTFAEAGILHILYTKLIWLQSYEKISEKSKFFPKEFFKRGGIFWKTGFGGGLDGGGG